VSAAGEALEARLRALEDRHEIEDLVARYASVQDDRRFDEYEACFTEDIVLEFPWGTVEGRAGLGERIRGLLEPFSYTQHLISDVEVALDGDRASGRANFFVTMVKADDPEGRYWHEVGFYRHEYRRLPDGWRFSRIECISHLRSRGKLRPSQPTA
jgi:3-phenylpropionate/cinnamic acid dioxygenase small subunit